MELKEKFKKCLKKMSKSKNKDSIDFQFISEKPKDGKLLFGHEEIVNTLEKVVLKSPESFTIGLYGDWGSGKSSIAETLQSNLKSQNIPLVIFDVWKHEGDALRRTFLKDIDKKLSSKSFGKKYYKEGFKLEKNLESDINIETKDGYDFKGKKLFKNFIVIALFAIIPLILVFSGLLGIGKVFSIEEFSFDSLIEKIVQIIGGLTIPVVFWLKFSNYFIVERKTTVKKSRIQDPIEFENSFRNILGNLTGNVSKIVVVFDNLDRVNGKKAVEIISTIKTFLEPVDKKNIKDVVFIIPCDSIAIKKHLASTFSVNDNQYADEFLRKFFNTIIWIPEFYSTELQGLASEKLKETNVPDLDNINLAALIVIVFDQNPRQIIQFINILLANYLLINERINEGKISGFSLENNITQLAKYLLLIQKFPSIMEVYKNELIYDLNKDIDEFADKKIYGIESHSIEEFKEFRDLTSQWHIESLDFYFKFRITQFEAAFENSTRLISLLQSNRIKDIFKDSSEKEKKEREYLDSLDIKTKTEELSNIVKQKVNTNNYPLIVTQFINGLLELTKHYGITLNDDAYREIYNKLRKAVFKSELYRIDINNLIEECINKINDTKLKASFLNMAKKQWIIEFNNYHKKENNEE
jgi:GTPase SAR1 family protein